MSVVSIWIYEIGSGKKDQLPVKITAHLACDDGILYIAFMAKGRTLLKSGPIFRIGTGRFGTSPGILPLLRRFPRPNRCIRPSPYKKSGPIGPPFFEKWWS